MKVYLALKHPMHPYGSQQMFLEAATVEGVFANKADAQELVDFKNAKTVYYKWSVQTKTVKEGK